MKHGNAIDLASYVSENGTLTVLADAGFPLNLSRVFTVQAKSGDIRGQHAHRTCTQLLYCVAGEIEVDLESLSGKDTFKLRVGGPAILVPPMTWGVQRFLADESILLVLADGNYEESEYIRDWNEFVTLSKNEVDGPLEPLT